MWMIWAFLYAGNTLNGNFAICTWMDILSIQFTFSGKTEMDGIFALPIFLCTFQMIFCENFKLLGIYGWFNN